MGVLAGVVVAGEQRIWRDAEGPMCRAVEVNVTADGAAQSDLVVIETSDAGWTRGGSGSADFLVEVSVSTAEESVEDNRHVLVVRSLIFGTGEEHVLRYEDAAFVVVRTGCTRGGAAGAQVGAAAALDAPVLGQPVGAGHIE